MSKKQIILYTDSFWVSPWVFSAFIALSEKGQPFEVRELRLHEKDQNRGAYQSSTLTGRVPAIEHDGFWLAESLAIVEYVDEAILGGNPLWPSDLKDRAHARQLCSWIRSTDPLPITQERPTHTMFYERAKKPLSESGERAVAKLYEVADRFVKAGEPHLFGQWCIADSDLAFLLHRLILNGHDLPEKLLQYAQMQWKRPSVIKWVSHPRIPYIPY